MTNPAITKILEAIEEARASGALNNESARCASIVLGMEGDEAMLANRVIAQGADPASLELLKLGHISEKVALAHRAGPGIYAADDPDRMHYLTLCAMSADESKGGGLRERVLEFAQSLYDLGCLETMMNPDPNYLEECAEVELAKIMSIPYANVGIKGVDMRLYKSDRGFAQAYWEGERCAAVYADDPRGAYVAIGCAPGHTLKEIGLEVDKEIAPAFGIFTSENVVEGIRACLDDVA